jgi:rhodanese-related sulfurtransferase
MSDFEVGVEEALKLIDDGAVVVDVREQFEWDAGYVAGSQHIPMAELPEQFDELPDDRRIVVVCHSGGRSAHATMFLVQQGYDAVNLVGGLVAWADAGHALTTDTGAPGAVD